MTTVASVLGAVLLGLVALLALVVGRGLLGRLIRIGFRLWIASPAREQEPRIQEDQEQRASLWAVVLFPLGILIAVTIIGMIFSCVQQP